MNSKRPFGSEPFSIEVRVYFEDTDAAGVVYYANYLRFMERARTELLRSAGINLGDLATERNLTFVVVDVAVKYLKPARLDDLLWIGVDISSVGRSALVFEQQIRRGGPGGELLCEGTIRAACVSADELKPRPIPKSLFVE